MTKDELQKRFKNWAVSVVQFTRKLPVGAEFSAILNQMVRCAPSAAANYRAACRAKSTADFINKLKIVEEESDETLFWLEFVVALEPALRPDIVTIYKEGDELVAITVKSIKTARQNRD